MVLMIIYFIRNQAQGKNDYEISDFKILETKLSKNCDGEQAKDYFCIEKIIIKYKKKKNNKKISKKS